VDDSGSVTSVDTLLAIKPDDGILEMGDNERVVEGLAEVFHIG